MNKIRWEAENTMAFRLRDLEAEIERTKNAELELLRAIWLDKLSAVKRQKPEYLLWIRIECRH
jgi:hypothetical protein